ncbi:MAG: hypothetical protein LQ350_007104 [Teloschistes chrysophthalmus]|nr:MAG: hypothetical protein LQ350_007104 [Niorma chrysophthalma]
MAQKWVDAEWTLLKRGDPHTFDTPSQNLTHSQIRWIVIWYKQWGSSRKSKRRRTTLWWTYYTPHRTSGPRMATLFDVEDPGCPTCDVDESETSSETIFVHLKPAHIRLGPFDRRASPPSNEFQIQETWVKRRFYNRDKVRRWEIRRLKIGSRQWVAAQDEQEVYSSRRHTRLQTPTARRQTNTNVTHTTETQPTPEATNDTGRKN